MSGLLSRWGSRVGALVAVIALTGCVITAAGTYFDQSDFVVPKVFTGNWVGVPDEGSEKSEEALRVRLEPTKDGLYRAYSLTDKGVIDPKEEPADFGLVDLGAGNYILVSVEDDGDGKKSEFLGVKADEGKITFYLFDGGGDTPSAQQAFKEALTGAGLSSDPSFKYETRLTGDITKDKIRALFSHLMSAPMSFAPDVSVYKKTK